ncbi:MAG: type III pantothenate kinase [Fimbriimonadaceae bacterium]|nr:type III pantothenate kinase [Fimbriimonadaceae bacterium]
MLLAIDIGNSAVTAGLWRDGRWVATWQTPTRGDAAPGDLLGQWLASAGGCGVVIGSVVPEVTPRWRQAAARHGPVRVVGDDLPLPLTAVYDPPASLGRDRLLAAAGAVAGWGAPVLIADCGTATCVDAVDASGRFVGGSIACGLGLQAEALAQRAAQLPAVRPAATSRALGQSTLACLQSGLVLGHVGLVRHLAACLRAELAVPDAPLIGTGGWAAVLAASDARLFSALAPDLLLDGLRLCWEAARSAP